MFKRVNAATRGYAVAALFALFALFVLGYGCVQLIRSQPASWTYILALITAVTISGHFRVQVGKSPGPPYVGVAIVLLAIPPFPASPLLSVFIWAIGIAISQMILRRSVLHSLSMTGLGAAAALAFASTQAALSTAGVWPPLYFLISALAYYAVFLLGQFAIEWTRSLLEPRLNVSAVSFTRVGYVVVSVAVAAAAVHYIDASVIPWLESDLQASRSSLIVMLVALAIYVLAQRARYIEIEKRMSALVDAAVELPRHTGEDLPGVLLNRARAILPGNDVELRDSSPERNEIGAMVSLDRDVDQHLIAAQKIGGVPFFREDSHALTTLSHVASVVARMQREVNEMEQLANTDALTGLPNYGAFQKALVETNEHRPYHEGIALLFIDLDNFKQLNDNLGHRAGDELLRIIAERLQRAAGGGDFVSRVGGDEFIVILTGLVSIEQAKESADRIVNAMCQPLMLDGKMLRPAVSAGLAYSGHRELDAQTLVEDADRTMLRAKRSRQQENSVHTSSVSVSSHRSSRTNDIVARAINEDRLALAFQPIVSLDTGEIWAFEALVRYTDPELGPISPPSLVARAKSLGLLNELTRQVVTKALAAAEEFRALQPGIRCMTVNFELGQISESELGPFIRESAQAHPEISLCVELNERSLRLVTDELSLDAEAMQNAGVLIALDDYGSDDSPVAALVQFTMNILKVDKSLINDLTDTRQREIIRTLQSFSDNLEYTMVIEGVETQEMVEALVELGARCAQGYFFGRPQSFPQTMERLRKFGTKADITGV